MKSAVKSNNPWEIHSKKTKTDIQIITKNRDFSNMTQYFKKKRRKSHQACNQGEEEIRSDRKKKRLHLKMLKKRNKSADPTKQRLNLNRTQGKTNPARRLITMKNFRIKRKQYEENQD
uniref:Uncharacterized protein n=1 Tax=Euplotes crassus TaxID=5936 RepID=A0A7S3KS49_EUPCR|mmetsp:Transcript_38061/g.37562  ORF Transcript_38061/g.37562 Transcript_38061/m.37562 type:complete len:118 (+) Transcript_38061:530-883(+)